MTQNVLDAIKRKDEISSSPSVIEAGIIAESSFTKNLADALRLIIQLGDVDQSAIDKIRESVYGELLEDLERKSSELKGEIRLIDEESEQLSSGGRVSDSNFMDIKANLLRGQLLELRTSHAYLSSHMKSIVEG